MCRLSPLLLLVVCLVLVGCGGGSSPADSKAQELPAATSAPSADTPADAAEVSPQYKWSAYATVVIRVAPGTSLGWGSYVDLWDGKGRHWGRRAPSNGVAPSVSFSGVFVDKTLKIRVRYADGRSWYYYRPAGRPWGSTRTVNVFYGGSSSG